VGKIRERADFVDKLIHVSVANHYDSDGWDSLSATAKNKSRHLKMPWVLMLKNQH
jgi:hypothetical protein